MSGSRPKAAPARVVFADDDATFRDLLRALLSLLPHATVVDEAADGIEAVRMVSRHYPDTVILDVNMPGLDGIYRGRDHPQLPTRDEAPAPHGHG